MGTYFNPDSIAFENVLRDDIYIDKTGLLEILNRRVDTEDNCVALSHARRFGKSQAAEMISAYYSRGCDSRELFSGLEIASKDGFENPPEQVQRHPSGRLLVHRRPQGRPRGLHHRRALS